MTQETANAFNEYLKNWQGGALSGIELNYNITGDGGYEFGQMYDNEWIPAPTNIEAALTQAVGDWTAGDIAVDPVVDPVIGPKGREERLISSTESILSGITASEFDLEKSNELFDAGVAVPAGKRFREYSVPAIEKGKGGHALSGSARVKRVAQAAKDLDEYLAGEQAFWTRTAENTFETRRETAINQTMTLITLPTEIANAKIAGQATKALIAQTFNNIDVTNAMLEMDLTNGDLGALLTAWTLLGTEQMQEDKEFMAKFANALRGEEAVTLDELMALLGGYQAESQTAIVTSG